MIMIGSVPIAAISTLPFAQSVILESAMHLDLKVRFNTVLPCFALSKLVSCI
jgi:hypothetical protein